MSTVSAYRIIDPDTQHAKPMTVTEMIGVLEQMDADPDATIILASDAEENQHRTLLELYHDGANVVLVPFD